MKEYFCPKCGALLVSRIYYVAGNLVVDWFCSCYHGYSTTSVETYSTNSCDDIFRKYLT